MRNVYDITNEFEKKLSEYTGAPYVITVDNMSNGLYLSLLYEGIKGKTITIPSRTYPSVPCEIIRAGGRVAFKHSEGSTLRGAYDLEGSRSVDSALRFTSNMYVPGKFINISFTGPYKHLKLSKGGAILTDDYNAMLWFKRARFSGRNEVSYHTDYFNMLGINCYLMPEISARGLLLMNQFYDINGNPKNNEDLELKYPDLSKFPIYTCDPKDINHRGEYDPK